MTKPDELKKLPREFDWVVNCVAAGGGAENYREVYFNGTKNLIEWLAPNPPKKFVYTSSTSVYAQNDGSPVKGYFVWSLLDNFEWHLGYGPKFGLVAVAPGTFERRPKPSAYWFGEVARANALIPPPR